MWNGYNNRQYKWDEMFKDEDEMIDSLSQIDVHKFHELCNKYICNGYQYITTMVRTVNSGRELSPAQVRQLKRLAKQVKIYHETKHLVD